MKLQEYLNIPWEQINKMSYNELYNYQKIIGTYAKRRRNAALLAYNKHDIPLPIIYKDDKYNIEFKPDFIENPTQKDINKLRSLTSKTRYFLNTKTSTIKGWKEVLNDFAGRVSEKIGTKFELSENQYKALWDIYNKLEQELPSVITKDTYDSNQRQGEIYEMIKNFNISSTDNATYDDFINGMLKKFRDRVTSLYENKDDDITDFDVLSLGANNEEPIEENFIKRTK